MEFNIFGIKVRLEVVLLCVALGMIIGTELLCSCVKKEGFNFAASYLTHSMRHGFPTLRETFDAMKPVNDSSETYEEV